MVFSMYDFPYFFVAIPSGSNPAGLSQYITKITEDFNVGRIELFSSDGLIVVGLEQTIARVKTISPVQSEILVKGLQACGGSTFQAVLFPSSDQRRILSEMLPAIPFESGRIELSSLTNNMQWAALGFNTPPSASIHFTIQSTSAEAADSNLTLIKSLFSFLGQNPDIRKFMPEVNQVLKHLIPQRHDKQLLLQVDTITADSIINDFIAPSLLKVNTTATRLACAKNLKSLGMALFIYANDYDDQLPPDMETLLQYEVSENSLVCPATKLKDSYIFRGANLKTSEPPFMIWIYDKKGNHEGGRYVLFNDGHVDWATEERFMELIEEDNKYRMEKGLPVIPAQ